eukprot:g3044.t1
MKTVCVLGASGFIGKKTVEALLLQKTYNVRASVRKTSIIPEELKKNDSLKIMYSDICDRSSLIPVIKGCDIVINAAGVYRWWVPNDKLYKEVNEDGARNVAQVCADEKIPHLLHISTAMAYGYPQDDKPFTENSKPGPFAAQYTRTKANGDQAVIDVQKQFETFQLDILYLACVTGPGDTFSVGRPAAVYRDFMLGKIPMLVAPDTNYIYVAIQDVVKAIRIVCERRSDLKTQDKMIERYLIGNSDQMMTTRQYFDLMSRYCDRKTPTASLNLSIGFCLAYLMTYISTYVTGSEPSLPLDIMRTAYWGGIEYSCEKSMKKLGMEYTPIETAVAESIADVKVRLKENEL